MIEELNRAIEQLFGRITGPMQFRLLLQPAMAILLAIRAGLRDARENKPAFLTEVAMNADERRKLLNSLWKDCRRLFLLAFVVDTVYQLFVFKFFYPFSLCSSPLFWLSYLI